ncbi:hypothetical protein T459_18774 [Capsicum annuum]|uniref:Uncharacterized protein n=1 Tax=Capsicum annuum TaxID=4072 RepID=A0A2G2YZR7_CAPAN|nr:hypothetical protein T459_18774 [Capsicum annuum]
MICNVSLKVEHLSVVFVRAWKSYSSLGLGKAIIDISLETVVLEHFVDHSRIKLIAKKEFDHSFFYTKEGGKKNVVDESFKEVDPETASRMTSLTYICTERKPEERPTMKDVLDVLTEAMKMEAKPRGRNEKEMKMKPQLSPAWCVYSHLARFGDGKMYAVHTTTFEEVDRLFSVDPRLRNILKSTTCKFELLVVIELGRKISFHLSA